MHIQHHAKSPLVSVIIPTFNRDNLILRALASLETQSFTNFEVIVCDDGSTDSTEEVVTTYARNISRYSLRYIRFSHCGVARARNIGLSLANARYIALLDSDDTYHPHKLEAQVEEIEQHQDSVFCYTGYQLMNTSLCIDPGTFEYNRFISENYLCCASVLMRRSAVVKAGGYDHRLHLAEDWDLLIRLSKKGSVLSIPDPMYEYYTHTNQITAKQSKLLNYFTSLVRCQHGGREIKTVGYLNFVKSGFMPD
jgi:glycosyltransferase involved in cell wall biosynthesis